jgi:hypothetical protein
MKLSLKLIAGVVVATATLYILSAFTGKDTATANENKYLEKLSPANAGLIMVDYLTGFDAGLRTIPKSVFNNNVTALAKMSNIFKLPTIVLGEEGGFRGNFYPLVKEHLSNAVRVERHTPSAWDEPNFRTAIEKMGRKKLIVAGISLDICTQLLTIDLLKAGYEVYVVVDCSGSDEFLVEQAAMMRMTQAGATMVSWGTLASELMKDWQSPYGEAVGKLYQEHSGWGGFYNYPAAKK